MVPQSRLVIVGTPCTDVVNQCVMFRKRTDKKSGRKKPRFGDVDITFHGAPDAELSVHGDASALTADATAELGPTAEEIVTSTPKQK